MNNDLLSLNQLGFFIDLFFFVWQFCTLYQYFFLILGPLLFITFPRGFRISKNIGHPILGSGGKKTFKRYLKREHTDRQTDRNTDISTYRKHRPDALKNKYINLPKKIVITTVAKFGFLNILPIGIFSPQYLCQALFATLLLTWERQGELLLNTDRCTLFAEPRRVFCPLS